MASVFTVRLREQVMQAKVGQVVVVALMLVAMAIPDGVTLAAGDTARADPDTAPSSGTWQRAESTDGEDLGFRDVLAWDKGFVAVGWPQGSRRRGDDVFAPVWLSDDGATWRQDGSVPLIAKQMDVVHLASLDDELYAVGRVGTHLAVWRSADGEQWHRISDRRSLSAVPPDADGRFRFDINDVVSGRGRIVVSGSYWTRDPDPSVEPVVWTTTDGRRWQRTDPSIPPPNNGIAGLGVLPRSFFGMVGTNRPAGCATGDDGSLPLTSRDGRDWDRVKRARPVCGLRAITFDTMSARYYAVAEAPDDGRAVVLASENLRSWEEVYRLPDAFDGTPWSTTASAIDGPGGGIIVIGEADWEGGRDGGTVWSLASPDGEEWDLLADWPTDEESGVGISSWAVGDEGVVLGIAGAAWYADLDRLGIESVEPLGKRAQRQADRAVGRINGELAEERPGIYVGGAVSAVPGGAPSLYVKGPAPQVVLDLVREAGVSINIVDDQPYSFDELEERRGRVHEALVDAGYLNVATGANITGGGVIPTSVLQVAGLPADPAEILAFVPEDLRADVELHVTVAPPRPSAEPGEWGLLAVLYQPGGFGPGVGLAPVTLRIGEKCVTVETANGKHATTLVWEGNHVDWRPKNRRIDFTDRKGKTVRLSDGDRIDGGGVSLWPSQPPDGQRRETPEPEPGRRWGAWLDEAWLQEPHPSCPERMFYLSEVTVK